MTTPTQEAYEELQGAFDHYNRDLFAYVLPPCLITMQREKRTYGYCIKYRCPSCAAQAWGKPSLRLLCGGQDCDAAPLVAVEE
ncbi:hypothetical protein [Pseudovibrio sp. POLY-S9]|uniref:hypothetical protein n=1 Tax=Pseudovibrio sp. POLY-S9 TaxID=1576596 RepID=UPI00070A1D59|nr:hypothetical protein [Pseudovibrio sp. POLY-S9]